MKEAGYNASKPKKTAKPSNPEFRGSFPAVAKKKVAKKATPVKYKSADAARTASTPARYKSPDAARAGRSTGAGLPARKTSVTVKDTRPGSTGGTTTFRTSSVNSKPKPRVKSAAMTAAEKYVSKSGSNFMSTAPIAPKPKAKPKSPSYKVTAKDKKTVAATAGWRY